MGSQNTTKRECGRRGRPGASRQRSGTVLLFLVFSLVGLLGLAALATDVGHVWAVRTELQGAVDAAALAGAANLVDATATTVTLDQARIAATNYGALNKADQGAVVIDGNADLTFGDWNLDTATFVTGVDLTDPEQVTAVRVEGRMDGVRNPRVAAVLGKLVGRNEFAVGATATGYLGWAGTFQPGTFDLPIVIDCCAITDGSCQNACDYLAANPYPNPTLLADGVTTATKLEFNSTPDQNACWTDFEQDTTIKTPEMEDLVRSGNTELVGASGDIQLDNGDKTPVISLIKQKFLGTGEYFGSPSGSDLYDPPEGIDSWVVKLPVVTCQTGDHCGGPYIVPIIGFICFEMREILLTPEKEIMGRFFCPGPGELPCDVGATGGGGVNFGVRATIPVLVQ